METVETVFASREISFTGGNVLRTFITLMICKMLSQSYLERALIGTIFVDNDNVIGSMPFEVFDIEGLS